MVINNKEILTKNTTILHTSSYNYNDDMIEFINNNGEVITKTNKININDIPLKTLEKYECSNLLTKKELTFLDEIKINILSSLNTSKDIIIFYDILNYLDNKTKTNLIKELQINNKTIINYTIEIEETLLLDYLIVVHNNKIIMEGNPKEILKEEKILKKLGFNLPLIVELSNGLKYYNVLNQTHYDIESMVNTLWK